MRQIFSRLDLMACRSAWVCRPPYTDTSLRMPLEEAGRFAPLAFTVLSPLKRFALWPSQNDQAAKPIQPASRRPPKRPEDNEQWPSDATSTRCIWMERREDKNQFGLRALLWRRWSNWLTLRVEGRPKRAACAVGRVNTL